MLVSQIRGEYILYSKNNFFDCELGITHGQLSVIFRLIVSFLDFKNLNFSFDNP